jgi:hypothetical protein
MPRSVNQLLKEQEEKNEANKGFLVDVKTFGQLLRMR